jgi:hypothetical protein
MEDAIPIRLMMRDLGSWIAASVLRAGQAREALGLAHRPFAQPLAEARVRRDPFPAPNLDR